MAVKKRIEDLLNDLDKVSKELDNEDIGIEESIKKYKLAVELYKKAKKQLKESELQIEEIRRSLEDENE